MFEHKTSKTTPCTVAMGLNLQRFSSAVSLSLPATPAEAKVLPAHDTPQVLHIDDVGN